MAEHETDDLEVVSSNPTGDIFDEIYFVLCNFRSVRLSDRNVYCEKLNCAFFSDCDCDSSYHSKWATQDSMEMFTIWNSDKVTSSYTAHCKQKQIAVENHSVNGPLRNKSIQS